MRLLTIILGFMLVLFAGCSDDDNGTNPSAGKHTVMLSFQGLEPLKNGYHYEGWVLVGGAAVSTGRFNVDAQGGLVNLSGATISGGEFEVADDLTGTTAIIVTIEPSGDSDPSPASTHILAGDVADYEASLSAGHMAALGDDFSGASGDYILATPTNGAETNENSGVWFLSLAGGSPAQGLDLPALPEGWAYEGWMVIDGTPVTSGTFTNLAAADDSAPFSDIEAGPPFPGEDYLNNAPVGLTFPTDLAGTTAVISIEPSPDDDPGPFTFKPLVGQVAADATDHTTYSMGNNAIGFPTGSATVTQ